ncbi:MAG: hypothetical protein OXC55_05110 [Chloroflexi bacterium]|nr:hypothetical protein [Chloroflexota bacterium]
MADGVERIFGYLSVAAENNIPSEIGVEVSSDSHHAAGSVAGADGTNLFAVSFESQEGQRVEAKITFDSSKVSIDQASALTKAVWEGAASKGFPKNNWKY